MKLYLSEITEEPRELSFTESEQWLRDVVFGVDETSTSKGGTPESRVIDAKYKIRRMDRIFWLDGTLHTSIQLLCSRCASPFFLECKPTFATLFTKDPVMAGMTQPAKYADIDGNEAEGWQWRKGVRGHQNMHTDPEQDAKFGSDLDLTYLQEDVLDLSQVTEEQLRLQIPAQPLCKEDCKGLCVNCGKDLNFETCGCEVAARSNPFAVLKQMNYS